VDLLTAIVGKIKSVQLEYTEAYKCLLGAIRKSPQNSARGFRIAAYKLACIVQLLMGEIPERSIFRQPGLKSALAPYLQLTQVSFSSV
jgi:26S proteasome regulatory subunit N3